MVIQTFSTLLLDFKKQQILIEQSIFLLTFNTITILQSYVSQILIQLVDFMRATLSD